jgi:hypothetical protein
MLLPGFITGRFLKIIGTNAAVANTEEHLADFSSTFTDLAAATLVKVASSSTDDDAGGTGALTVGLHGIDANYKMVSETITLDGQTAVASVNTYLAILGAEVLTAGAGLKNAGNINIADDGATFTAGVPGTLFLCQIPIGKNVSYSGNAIIPAGSRYRAKSITIFNSTQIARLFIKAKEYGGLWKYVHTLPCSASHAAHIDLSDLDLVFQEKTSIELAAIAATSGAVMNATLILEAMPQ